MAFIGFDDTPISATVDPPLTTVRQPIEQMGRLATALLLDTIDARQNGAEPDEQPQVITLPTELVSRASCATRPASGPSNAAAGQDVAAG